MSRGTRRAASRPRWTAVPTLALAVLATLPGTVAAQQAGAPPDTASTAAAAARQAAGGLRPLTVAKWTTLTLAVGAAAYGYSENRLADSRYQDLNRICQAQPVQCFQRTSTGAYADAGMEARYQEVRRLDGRAAVGLIAAEAAIGASVVLFLLDLRHAGHEPPNIPYRPPALRVGPGRHGGIELGLRVSPAPGWKPVRQAR